MKQRRHLSNKISATFAASILSISLTGVTCGSFAWFTYMTRAKIEEFRGVTIGFGDLHAGILSDVDLPLAEQYGLIKDESNPEQIIYWFDGHQMNYETLRYVLSSNGYATDTLYPVSSRKYTSGEEFGLYAAPTILEDGNYIAEKSDYIHLPLVFKYEDIIEEGTFIPNENIYISQVKLTESQSDSYIHEAVRIYTSDRNSNTHLINPFSNNDGVTDVGGVLDLNGDGFYDANYFDTVGYEFVYGQVKESSYKAEPENDDTIIYPDERNAFNAGHRAGIYALETCVPEVAEYEGIYEFKNKHKHVTTTDPLMDNLAYLDLSIYVEGWDLKVVNSEIDIPFAMEITIETDL